MKIFLDTADVNEIRKGVEWGAVDGVTTNPSLAAKTGRPFKDVVLEICGLVDGDVSAETVSLDYEGMMREAHELASWHKNIVVKIPLTPVGMQAVRTCAEEDIKTNVTLCFSANQALLAAKAGAYIVSPFVGRLDDIGQDGMKLIEEIVGIYKNYDFDTQVLVASVRHPIHVVQSAKLGADIATMPFKVLEQLYKHQLTDAGIQRFLEDWKKAGLSIFENEKAVAREATG